MDNYARHISIIGIDIQVSVYSLHLPIHNILHAISNVYKLCVLSLTSG